MITNEELNERAKRFFAKVNPKNEILEISPLIPKQSLKSREELVCWVEPITAPYYTDEQLINLRRIYANNILLSLQHEQPKAIFELIKARLASYRYIEHAFQFLDAFFSFCLQSCVCIPSKNWKACSI